MIRRRGSASRFVDSGAGPEGAGGPVSIVLRNASASTVIALPSKRDSLTGVSNRRMFDPRTMAATASQR